MQWLLALPPWQLEQDEAALLPQGVARWGLLVHAELVRAVVQLQVVRPGWHRVLPVVRVALQAQAQMQAGGRTS